MNIKIFRGKNFTFEQMVFISKFEKWNLARRPKKKLAKILEETKDITKIEILKLSEIGFNDEVIKSIDWNKQSSRTKFYFLKVVFGKNMISNSMKIPEAGLTAPSDLMELFSRLFKNGLIEVKMHIKLFSAELQAAILLMYSYHTFTKDHLESKSIFSEIMENSRITSKILFDLGYYTLAGRKYHGENPNAGTFPHANFIDINSYSKKRAWELKNMHLGIIVDHNSYPDWEEKMEDFDYGYFFGRSSDNYYNYR